MRRRIARWLADGEAVIPASHRATHTYCVGQPGTGKSRALESWVMQDILAGHGVGVIDPHGDVFQNLLARIASRPALWERVIVIDPQNDKWVVSVDPFQMVGNFSRQRLALFMTDIVVKIWDINATTAPRMIWLLTNTFLALSDLKLTLLDLPRFLLDRAFREAQLPRLTREEVIAYFYLEFPRSEGAVHQWVTPILNKIGALLFDPDVRLMLAAGKPLDFRAVLDEKRILLVNLSKGLLGEATSALLGALIVAQMQKTALGRADTQDRPPYYLYLDEFQNYTTNNITDILSEARKYALSLIVAHQYLDQLSPDLRHAVLKTAGTLVSFRVSYPDALRLSKELFPSPDFIQKTEWRIRQDPLGMGTSLRFPLSMQQKSLGWEGLAQSLVNLPHRHFWSRQRERTAPVQLRTLEMADPVWTPSVAVAQQELLDRVGQQYGRLKRSVAQQVQAAGGWSPAGLDKLSRQDVGATLGHADRDHVHVPFWGA